MLGRLKEVDWVLLLLHSKLGHPDGDASKTSERIKVVMNWRVQISSVEGYFHPGSPSARAEVVNKSLFGLAFGGKVVYQRIDMKTSSDD
jgi:hypothetical protein